MTALATIMAGILLGTIACADATNADAGCAATWSPDGRPWNALTEAELCAAIRAADGWVFIGFKEANAPRGVDPYGRVLTTNGTVSRMISYVTTRGVVVEHAYGLIPAIAGRMPVTPSLVHEFGTHSNVDYLEPIFPGTRTGQ